MADAATSLLNDVLAVNAQHKEALRTKAELLRARAEPANDAGRPQIGASETSRQPADEAGVRSTLSGIAVGPSTYPFEPML